MWINLSLAKMQTLDLATSWHFEWKLLENVWQVSKIISTLWLLHWSCLQLVFYWKWTPLIMCVHWYWKFLLVFRTSILHDNTELFLKKSTRRRLPAAASDAAATVWQRTFDWLSLTKKDSRKAGIYNFKLCLKSTRHCFSYN